jgi:4-hydroxy-tetrahydrodipicolinate synthase
MQLMKLCSENIQIFTGDDKTSMSDIIDGFSGNISVTANVAPLEMHMMCKYAIEGNLEKATEINSKIETLHDILFCESNPIPVKWCLNKMGLIKKGIRLPLTWMDEKYDESLNNALIKTGVVNE